MTWAKIDDKLTYHPKVLAAGNEAVGAWVRMIAYAAAHLTDGRIPEGLVASIASPRALKALIATGLIERVDGDDDYYIHDYLQWNLSRQEVGERLEKDRIRQSIRRVPDRVKALVIQRDGLVCGICKLAVKRDEVHIDHKIPVVEGGSGGIENLQVTHAACNIKNGPRPRGRPRKLQPESVPSTGGVQLDNYPTPAGVVPSRLPAPARPPVRAQDPVPSRPVPEEEDLASPNPAPRLEERPTGGAEPAGDSTSSGVQETKSETRLRPIANDADLERRRSESLRALDELSRDPSFAGASK